MGMLRAIFQDLKSWSDHCDYLDREARREENRIAYEEREVKREENRLAYEERVSKRKKIADEIAKNMLSGKLNLTCRKCKDEAVPMKGTYNRYACQFCGKKFYSKPHKVPLI